MLVFILCILLLTHIVDPLPFFPPLLFSILQLSMVFPKYLEKNGLLTLNNTALLCLRERVNDSEEKAFNRTMNGNLKNPTGKLTLEN